MGAVEYGFLATIMAAVIGAFSAIYAPRVSARLRERKATADRLAADRERVASERLEQWEGWREQRAAWTELLERYSHDAGRYREEAEGFRREMQDARVKLGECERRCEAQTAQISLLSQAVQQLREQQDARTR